MSALPATWITETLIASTLLIGAVLVLRRPATRLLGPRAAYLLWALPALRLLLPPIPGAKIMGLTLAAPPAFAPPQAVQALAASTVQGFEAAPTLQQAVAAGPALDWTPLLLVLWLGVAAIHMAWHVVSYRRFISGAVGSHGPAHSLDGILVYSADIAGPAAAGIVRRRILLPHDFADRFDPSERRLALAHEVAHHRRGDLVANWLALAVLSLHWFNPLAHIAYRAFRADQELACDATVLRAASQTERHAYASAVIKAAWVKSPVAACPMNSADQLKARLAMMKAGGAQRPFIGFATVAVVAMAALGVTASRTAASLPKLEATAGFASDAPAGSAIVVVPQPAQSDVARAAANLDEGKLKLMPPPAPAATAPVANVPESGNPGSVSSLHLASVETLSEPVMVSYADARLEPTLDPLVPVQAATTPARTEPQAERQGLVVTPASFVVTPSPKVLSASAALARKEMERLSRGDVFVREARAVMVDGRFNAAQPGVAFVGFCGQVLFSGEARARPFFVSATPSKPGRAEKCSGPQSADDYSSHFRTSPARAAAARSARRFGCAADQSACGPTIYASLSRSGYSGSSEFMSGRVIR